jgi:formamidopyrimidine-DNA glycosylase
MTGRLIYTRNKTKQPHLRAALDFNQGQLLFIDPRRFGTIEVASQIDDLRGTGVEPLTDALNLKSLSQLLGSSKQPIKTWLMRQDKIVGIGNIYASEILYDAQISPRRRVASLSRIERERLLKSIKKILTKAIKHCGTTFSDFQDAHGVTGAYQRFLKVYECEGLKCSRCEGLIRRIVQQQRSTYYCSCQG